MYPEPVRSRVQGFTIDGPTSKDLDDAIWVERTPVGWIVHVSIADVASAVAKDSPFDREALQRGFTEYFAYGNKPMLPRGLSENRASLLPNYPRETITVSIPIFKDFSLGTVQIAFTRLQSIAKLHYAQVDELLKESEREQSSLDSLLHEQLLECNIIAMGLLAKRRAAGALALYDLRHGWATNEEGILKPLKSTERNRGMIIIQEFMILTNTCVAEFLLKAGVTALFRNHTAHPASPTAANLMEEMLHALASSESAVLSNLQKRMSFVLNRATYGATVLGHFGLQLPVYLHFTSPIRRYADLVNHRMLTAVLRKESPPYSVDELIALGESLTKRQFEIKDRKDRALLEKRRDATRTEVLGRGFLSAHANDFYRMLKLVCRENRLDELFLNSCLQRLEAGTLMVRDIYYLFFETNEAVQQNPAWIRFKTAVGNWLHTCRSDAVSLLTVAYQHKKITEPVYDESKTGPQHMATFTVTVRLMWREREYTGRGLLWSAQQARQLAVLRVLQSMFDLAAESDSDAVIVGSVPIVSSSEPKSEINWKGLLQELCQSREWTSPAFNVRRSGADHQSVFTATVELDALGKRFSAQGVGTSKKNAEQEAARMLYAQLTETLRKNIPGRARVTRESAAEDTQSHNYVSRLQEWCAQRKEELPHYTVTHSGAKNQGPFEFICTVVLSDGRTMTHSGQGSNKQQAKQAAAEQVYTEVTQCNAQPS